MTRDRVDSALAFGTGTSSDHAHGIRWVDYTNTSWNRTAERRTSEGSTTAD
jgi:hypothetical protein